MMLDFLRWLFGFKKKQTLASLERKLNNKITNIGSMPTRSSVRDTLRSHRYVSNAPMYTEPVYIPADYYEEIVEVIPDEVIVEEVIQYEDTDNAEVESTDSTESPIVIEQSDLDENFS